MAGARTSAQGISFEALGKTSHGYWKIRYQVGSIQVSCQTFHDVGTYVLRSLSTTMTIQ